MMMVRKAIAPPIPMTTANPAMNGIAKMPRIKPIRPANGVPQSPQPS